MRLGTVAVRFVYVVIAAGILGCSESTSPIERTARQPIVFVHGLGGSADNWAPVLARFRADGWTDRELYAASYSSFASNANVAGAISDRVDAAISASGWDKVDLVSYSMGSLSSRYYLKNLGGIQKVDAWVSVSGPNHGTESSLQCFLPMCIESRPGSEFLSALNSGDETPGVVRYATWWSPCDETVVPPQSTILEGAVNTETECLPHTGMFTETNYQQVKAFIAP